MGIDTSGRVRSIGISNTPNPSEVNPSRSPASRVAGVKAVSENFISWHANSWIAQACLEADSPGLEDCFAGAYPGEQWGNRQRKFVMDDLVDHSLPDDESTLAVTERASILSELLARDYGAPDFVDFLEFGDLIDFSAPVDGPDLIDFSNPVEDGAPDLIEWRTVGATKEIIDEESELDELMAANPNTQDQTEMLPAGGKGYLQFDASGQIEDEQSSVEKTIVGEKSSFEEMMAEIARESARVRDLIVKSPPELMVSPIESEAFPDGIWADIAKQSARSMRQAPVESESKVFSAVQWDIFLRPHQHRG